MMSMTIKLSEELIEEARRHGDAFSRSLPKQIEHWARIGRMAEDNPDLPFSFIKDLMLASAEAQDAKLTPYTFG